MKSIIKKMLHHPIPLLLSLQAFGCAYANERYVYDIKECEIRISSPTKLIFREQSLTRRSGDLQGYVEKSLESPEWFVSGA